MLLLLFKIYVWFMQIDQYVFIHFALRVGIKFVFAIFMTLDHCSSIMLTSEAVESKKDLQLRGLWKFKVWLTTLPLTSLNFMDAVALLFLVISALKISFSNCSFFVFLKNFRQFDTLTDRRTVSWSIQLSVLFFFQPPAWPELCSGFLWLYQEMYIIICSHSTCK